jgi:hypothetical protein
MPTIFDRRVIRLRAIALGWYPSFLAESRTLRRVFLETELSREKDRETVDCETPASFATWFEVIAGFLEFIRGKLSRI